MSDFENHEEQLSAYLDGELSQQQSQRVEIELRRSPELRARLEELRKLRERIRQLNYTEPSEEEWRKVMAGTTFKATRGLGWLLWIGAAVVLVGYGLYEFAGDPGVRLFERIGIFTMLAGVLLVFVTVLYERIVAHRHDKYKDIEK
ncbi:MAG: hypothetical protein ABIG44_15040 [Planctomycetota bacterium]